MKDGGWGMWGAGWGHLRVICVGSIGSFVVLALLGPKLIIDQFDCSTAILFECNSQQFDRIRYGARS